jgi:hypothetical protein
MEPSLSIVNFLKGTLLSVATGSLALTSLAAEINKGSIGPDVIEITGRVVAGDYEKLKRVMNDLDGDSVFSGRYSETLIDGTKVEKPDWRHKGFVGISSQGGNVVEAMKMGRLIRNKRHGVHINIPLDAVARTGEVIGQCYSSCVYILAAGLVRLSAIPPSVGIHRPYIASSRASSVESILKNVLEDSRTYFAEH